MKYSRKKEGFALPFSYMDVFFILLAVLALSFGIYYIAERNDRNADTLYETVLRANIRKEYQSSIPDEGELLYEDQKAVGEVLSVEVKETAEVFRVKAVCLRKGNAPEKGKEIKLETADSVCTMSVESVKKRDGSWEGRNLK